MKLNCKSLSSINISQKKHKFPDKYLGIKKSGLSSVILSTIQSGEYQVHSRNQTIKKRIMKEIDKQNWILGSHKKTATVQIRELEDKDLSLLKFRRTPSPVKNSFRNYASPIKQKATSNNHFKLLTQRFNTDIEETLKIKLNPNKDLKKLKEVGFIDDKGIVNLKFVSRYEEVIRNKYPMMRSVTSIFKTKRKNGHK